MVRLLAILLLFNGLSVCSQQPKTEQPVKVSYCELKKDPAAHNHKLIEITAFVSHGFENFTLFDPTCPGFPAVWLEYGGTNVSGTMYCCGVTAARSRPEQLVVENIPISLVTDERFKEFDDLIRIGPDSVVRATVTGRFFSGEYMDSPGGSFHGGYGHMGCCSLLAIQQVVSVEPRNSTELDYRSSPDQPNLDRAGCGYRFLTELDTRPDSLKAQALAELGQTNWVFTDPKRVATENLARLTNTRATSINLRQTEKAQGRFIYEWRPRGKQLTYMVVVSRPYWLSFYAKDPNRVAWVVAAAYQAGCSGRNQVERIK